MEVNNSSLKVWLERNFYVCHSLLLKPVHHFPSQKDNWQYAVLFESKCDYIAVPCVLKSDLKDPTEH